MDQKLLDALSNMSEALEQIAEALKKKDGNKSATTEAMQGGDFVKQIKEINVGVKQLQADTKKMLKNQETIISLSKKASGDKKSAFEEAGGDKKKENDMKKGIGTILLIAVDQPVLRVVAREGLVEGTDGLFQDALVLFGFPLGLPSGTDVHEGDHMTAARHAATANFHPGAIGSFALEDLTVTARDGKTTPDDMSNGTITITNLGSFGVDTGTPIINPGEVSIVVLGTIKQKPWVVDGNIEPRFVTTIGASFDHRVVDGDVASRFLADIASIIEEPALLLD